MRATRRKTATVVALAVLALSVLIPVSAGAEVTEQHCPGANEANAPAVPEGYEVLDKVEALSTELDDVVSDADHVCVKGGPYASGIVEPEGRTLREILEDAGITVGTENVPGVSYYLTYRRPTVEVTVTIAKAWTGDLDGAPEGAAPRFTVSLNGMSQEVGVDEIATFAGLLPGESYTITWEELVGSLPAPFLDDAGNLCSFDAGSSAISGEETVVAGGLLVLDVEVPLPQAFAFTAENAYDCVPTTGPAEVQVSKIWTVDGEELTEVPDGVAVSFEVSVGEQTETLAGDGVVVFDGLELGVAYPVAVEEVAIDGLDLDDLGEGCELVSQDVVLSAETVTPGGDDLVTAEVTNAYLCTSVQPRVLTSVEIQAAKTWFRTSTAGLVELTSVPTTAAPRYEVVLRGGPDGDLVGVYLVEPGDELLVTGLIEGASYRMTWEEVDPLAAFDLGAERCTWSGADSVYFGSEEFIAGDVDTVTFAGVNAYTCVEVQGTVLPQTGVSAVWLSLLGLLGLGLGGGLLGGRRRS
ncbi:MAG: LPXTG cell wall anchor domain-containing protein [Nitriliruptoraceae bacterium]